jgi:hypothetical protein
MTAADKAFSKTNSTATLHRQRQQQWTINQPMTRQVGTIEPIRCNRAEGKAGAAAEDSWPACACMYILAALPVQQRINI